MPSARTATEQRTIDVEVEGVRADGRTLRGHAAVFNVLSEDLGGFRERIAPGAFADVLDDDVRLLVDHEPPPLARTKAGTLRLHEDERGLAFEADLPDTTAARDLRESVSRGDVDGASFRFVVSEEQWEGDVRTIVRVGQLRDVTVATYPAYPTASIELRSRNTTGGERRQKGANMDPQETGADNAEQSTETNVKLTDKPAAEVATSDKPAADVKVADLPADKRSAQQPAGALRVEERTSAPQRRGLADEFRAAGFPGEVAEIPWERFEERAVTWSASIDLLNQADRQGVPLGWDARYAWPAIPRVAVEAGVTSVSVLTQVSTTADAVTGVIRAVDATTDKAEVETTIDFLNTPLSGVAAVESGIPNVYLESPAVNGIIETDLRRTVNEGLDGIVNATFAASDNQPPGSDPLPTSIRKAITVLQAYGYAPDTVILTPTAAEGLDTLVSGVTGGDADYVFGAGNFASGVYGLRRVVSKVVTDPVVLDSTAYAKLYASPVRLARFEERDGRSNTSLVRCELHAACGVERQDAAVRVAAS